MRIAEHFAPAGAGISLGSFRLAFILIAMIALLGMLDSLSLGTSDGDEIRRKRKKSAATHSESDRTPEKSTQH